MATRTVTVCDSCNLPISPDEQKGSMSYYAVDEEGHPYFPEKVRYDTSNRYDMYSQGEVHFKRECMIKMVDYIIKNHATAKTKCNGMEHDRKNKY